MSSWVERAACKTLPSTGEGLSKYCPLTGQQIYLNKIIVSIFKTGLVTFDIFYFIF
jgi:hypothetical protein